MRIVGSNPILSDILAKLKANIELDKIFIDPSKNIRIYLRGHGSTAEHNTCTIEIGVQFALSPVT
jgi:hypothetical protein